MKKLEKNKTKLDELADQLGIALRRETESIVEIGNLLLEVRKHLKHGQWKNWVYENFNLHYRTALNYMAAAKFAALHKSETVSLLNLSPGVLRSLADGRFPPEEEAAILAAARERRIDGKAAEIICHEVREEHKRKAVGLTNDEIADDDGLEDTDDDQDGGAEDAPKEDDAETEAILDGPPPAVPSPADNVAPTNFALQDFDKAIDILKRLMTKPAGDFLSTSHEARDLESVNLFIASVAAAIKKLDQKDAS